MTELTPQMREVLAGRSTRNKIGVARDCELCPVGLLPVITELVADGIIVWIDRAAIWRAIRSDTMQPVICDVYLLTPKGVALCERHGIKQT